ncbi:CPX chromosomal region candidate gene 1 protein [Mastomys coucha]|uniref:CPX chromosomal region candidate gene 1 protein n=1 Tax=Mastomys coucha TaxID=35658 RepID=UPI001261CC0E|nr:CPX chromosomal region candidate gene 1 protein [Mastomys coucha]XP_031231929.1 CPX chromosomal region candidate gene 1 protein [Mastomys coucha]
MTSTNRGSDPAENSLKNAENDPPNACEEDKEHPLPDTNNISQLETNVSGTEPHSSSSQEDMDPTTVENRQSETEKTQNDPPDEELIEHSLPLQIPIPRKLTIPRLLLYRIIYLSISQLQPQRHDNKTLSDKMIFHLGRVEMTISDYSHNPIHDKMLNHSFLGWQIPFFNTDEICRMINHLLSSRNFSQPECHQHNALVKQKYVAVLDYENAINLQRNIVFGRPLIVRYYQPLFQRLTERKNTKLYQNKNGNHLSLRPNFYMPQFQSQNTVHRKDFKTNWETHYKLRLVIITDNNNWKYLCPICGCCFNNFYNFKHHSCSFS